MHDRMVRKEHCKFTTGNNIITEVYFSPELNKRIIPRISVSTVTPISLMSNENQDENIFGTVVPSPHSDTSSLTDEDSSKRIENIVLHHHLYHIISHHYQPKSTFEKIKKFLKESKKLFSFWNGQNKKNKEKKFRSYKSLSDMSKTKGKISHARAILYKLQQKKTLTPAEEIQFKNTMKILKSLSFRKE